MIIPIQTELWKTEMPVPTLSRRTTSATIAGPTARLTTMSALRTATPQNSHKDRDTSSTARLAAPKSGPAIMIGFLPTLSDNHPIRNGRGKETIPPTATVVVMASPLNEALPMATERPMLPSAFETIVRISARSRRMKAP